MALLPLSIETKTCNGKIHLLPYNNNILTVVGWANVFNEIMTTRHVVVNITIR